MSPSPMLTDSLLSAVETHAYWNGVGAGTVWTLVWTGVFFALGGRILIERVWQGHSQFNGDDR